ncbi:MAG: LapA family protein [Candidatus Marinimicrobia bacterium]|nr:LapA family protein [Candidatus Neomarinimicrobiota bacterium]
MKLVRIFAALTLVLALVYFLTQNAGDESKVYVDLLFADFPAAPVSMIMLGALAIGILIGYGVGVTSILSAKADNRALRTKNRRLSDELNDLRNVAIDEGIYDSEDEDV